MKQLQTRPSIISGDMRMGVAEDTHKISNIVTPNLHHFRSLYEEILDNEEHLLWDKNLGKFEQIPDFSTRWVQQSVS